QISSGKMVRLSTVKTLNDFKIMQLSWVYDLNFGSSFRLVTERDCINELAATLPRESRVEEAIQAVREFAGNNLPTP
ncbi:MAG TPA: HD family phosphohydrolase, partial [Geobacteraceae bacterium]|nr:HD family phosphohydrolase [Geobacteraceae bacterium]